MKYRYCIVSISRYRVSRIEVKIAKLTHPYQSERNRKECDVNKISVKLLCNKINYFCYT